MTWSKPLSQAYDFPVKVGLITFNNETKCECELTSCLEDFRDEMDAINCSGETKLFDAINLAQQKLTNHPYDVRKKKCVKRIIILSDGKDTSSGIEAYEVAKQLQSKNIICDAITIGAEENCKLKAIVKSTGGYCFNPRILQHALMINELEVMLFSKQRPIRKKNKWIKNQYDLTRLYYDEYDLCDEENQPLHRNKEDSIYECHTMTSIDNEFKEEVNETVDVKRIMAELKFLQKNPHPAIDIYLSDLSTWYLVIQGPDSTVYANGCFLMKCVFSKQYPTVAPEITFITPIKHCNINSTGRICHSILSRNYTSDVNMKIILDCIYGLLLQPDTSDPLDSVLALSFFQANGDYEAYIISYVNKYAKKTREQWRKELSV